jgi:hypothetical protein
MTMSVGFLPLRSLRIPVRFAGTLPIVAGSPRYSPEPLAIIGPAGSEFLTSSSPLPLSFRRTRPFMATTGGDAEVDIGFTFDGVQAECSYTGPPPANYCFGYFVFQLTLYGPFGFLDAGIDASYSQELDNAEEFGLPQNPYYLPAGIYTLNAIAQAQIDPPLAGEVVTPSSTYGSITADITVGVGEVDYYMTTTCPSPAPWPSFYWRPSDGW